MVSWTNPIIHATGDILAVTDWNGLANDATFLYQAPYGMAFLGTAQAIGAGTTDAVYLDTPTALGYGFALTGHALIVPLTGVYCCSATITYGNVSGTDPNSGFINHQGANVIQLALTTGEPANPVTTGSGLVLAAAGDYIDIQYSTGSGQQVYNGPANTFLHVHFVGSQ